MPRDIPAFSNPIRNRRVILQTRPTGVPQTEHFSLDEVDIPVPADGEILIRNVYLSVDPAQRGWAADVANYSAPVILGGPMRALAVGQVVQSRAAGFAKGDFLYGFFGWQDYATVTPAAVLHRCTQDLPLDAFASLCGINGVTAYLALTTLGRPKAGDTLLVSTAAGSVGSFVGQIGKGLGCRTIGLTGSDEKAEICTQRFGYDVAINYRSGDLAAAVDAAA
ncbi:MAG: NADP-dependent oxidoreductase [Candidatus Saccharibacteria bacterium]|nr:NADP-dependent oxidoreductase [Pseudorhodobacter sp.]